MKKLLLFGVIGLLISVMGGCEDKCEKEKNHISDCKGYSENEKKKEYVWYVNLGDEDGAYIEQQAKHFKVSSFEKRGKYIYQPKDNFIGVDSVEIHKKDYLFGELVIVYNLKFYITKCGMITKIKSKKTYKEKNK